MVFNATFNNISVISWWRNSVVIFSLSYHPQPPFRINPTTGEMLVNTALDRETTQNYTVTVTAYDLGNPAMSSVDLVTLPLSSACTFKV
jgi:hypothetical protein